VLHAVSSEQGDGSVAGIQPRNGDGRAPFSLRRWFSDLF
jgi:hypothetical protein